MVSFLRSFAIVGNIFPDIAVTY